MMSAPQAAGVGCCLRGIDADKDPAGGAVDRHEQIPASLLVRHLWQVFHVDMQVAGLVGLEGLVRGPRRLRLQVLQPGDAMPSQTAIEPRARYVRVQELAHHREQIVKRQQQPPARASASSAASVRCGCGRERCPACAISRPSARIRRSAPLPARLAPCSPGSFGVVVACL